MENNFVNIENAKLLKELGYNIPCKSRFADIDYIHPLDITLSNIKDCKEEKNWNATKDSVSVPEFEDVRAWLHKKYNVGIGITPSFWEINLGHEVDDPYTWFCRSSFGISDGTNFNEVYNKELKRVLMNLLKIEKDYE